MKWIPDGIFIVAPPDSPFMNTFAWRIGPAGPPCDARVVRAWGTTAEWWFRCGKPWLHRGDHGVGHLRPASAPTTEVHVAADEWLGA